MSSGNLKIWEQVCKTNPQYTKAVNQRGGFTTIDVYFQIHQATELWGAYGSSWGLRNLKRTLLLEAEMAFLDATFYYPDGEFEIGNNIDMKTRSARNGDKWDDEFVKKLETNTISKALSRLGFGADVFMGLFDDQRYVNELRQEFGLPVLTAPVTPAPPGSPVPVSGGAPPLPPGMRM